MFVVITRFYGGTGPDDGVAKNCICPDLGTRSDDAGIGVDLGTWINDCVRVDGVGAPFAEVSVNLVVGLGVADIKPIAVIEHDGSELFLPDELNECGHDGDDFLVRYERENFWLDAINAGELMCAGCVAE